MSTGWSESVSGSLGAAGGSVTIRPDGRPVVALEIEGTFVQSLEIEETINGSTWVDAQVFTEAGAGDSATQTATGRWLIQAAGRTGIRVRQTAFTSGTAAIVLSTGLGAIGSSGGGGGGAVTMADGASVTLGAKADAAAGTDTATASLIALFKRLLTRVTALLGQLPAALVGGRLDVNLGAAPATVTVGGSAAAGVPPVGNPISVAGFDGTNKQHLKTDTGGNQIVVGAAAVGAALAGNPVLAGLSDGTNAQSFHTALPNNNGLPNTSVAAVALYMGQGSSNYVPMNTLNAANGDGAAGAASLPVGIFLNNGTNFDRARNNVDVVDLASGARTTTQNIDITTYNGRALIVTLDATSPSGAFGGTASLTVAISYKDPASGKFVQLHASFTPITAGGTYTYVIGSGAALVGGVTGIGANPIGRTMRITVTPADATSITYSLGHCVVCQ